MYIYSEIAMPFCKWGQAVSLQCSKPVTLVSGWG